MASLELRAARLDEADAVLRFWAAAAEGTSVSDDPDGVRGLIAHDPEALILAIETREPVDGGADGTGGGTSGGGDDVDGGDGDGGERIVGSVIAGFDGWRCHLYRLAVAPDARRRGVGTLLVEAAERRFAALGGRRVDAMVLERNLTAHAAWSAAGYLREDHWRRWIKPLR